VIVPHFPNRRREVESHPPGRFPGGLSFLLAGRGHDRPRIGTMMLCLMWRWESADVPYPFGLDRPDSISQRGRGSTHRGSRKVV